MIRKLKSAIPNHQSKIFSVPGVVHHQIKISETMALFAVEIAEAEQWRRSGRYSRRLRNPCGWTLGNLKRPCGSGDLSDQLVENAFFQAPYLGISTGGLLFARCGALLILR
jgi:hypothetical protein